MLSSLGYAVPVGASVLGGGAASPAILNVTMILTGGFLVVLSIRWRHMREAVLERLPGAIRANPPRTLLVHERPRPVR